MNNGNCHAKFFKNDKEPIVEKVHQEKQHMKLKIKCLQTWFCMAHMFNHALTWSMKKGFLPETVTNIHSYG